MGRIRQMDEHLATLIAAGEVVAGPVSVVRELIDNALDASATAIDVAVEEGGLRSIRVADDGCGMDEEDAVLCLARHATSKLSAPDELGAIRTLGFRGEALAAIVAVSHLRLETRRPEDDAGSAVRAVGGRIADRGPVARRAGTTVEVGHLFFNTPARREFLDTPRAEMTRVVQAVERLAIARPAVRFTLREGEREVLNLPAAADPLERVRQVHGAAFADALIPVRGQRGEVVVEGWVVRPDAAVRRARRTVTAVNGRPFESFEIRRLLTSTFAGVVPYGHHVEAVLRIELPPADVDVNVSPDKSKVRFRRAGQVLAAVSDALRAVLADRAATVSLEPGPLRETHLEGASSPPPAADVAARVEAVRRYEEELGGAPDTWERMFGVRERPGPIGAAPAAAIPGPLHGAAGEPATEPAGPPPRHGIPADPGTVLQVADTFLVCATAEGMLIVDQHSAHERVNYERLRARWEVSGRNPDVQPLLFPTALNLDAGQAALLEEMQPFLERLGFEITPAGPRQALVQAVPAALGERSVERALEALMEVYAAERSAGVRSADVGEGITPVEDRMLQTVACHAAVKGGQPLAEAEIRSLWRDLVRVDLACHDVHGRPAVLRVPTSEIARRMGRA
jgi:DNA mismatch repair protein MutL